MSVSSVPSATSAVAALAQSTSTAKLVKLANGEYTAASVSADQADALKLALVKEKDGNYGTSASKDGSASKPAAKPLDVSGSAASSSSAGVLSALNDLTLGG